MVTLSDRSGGEERKDSVSSWFKSLRYFSPSRPTTADVELPWLAHYPKSVPAHLAYPQQPLGWLLKQAAERFPTRLACIYYQEELTYEQLFDQALALASRMQQEGLKPGDRVGVLLPNLPESIVSLFAVWLAGGEVVSLSPLMVADEVAGLIKATDCQMVITVDVLTPLVCHGEHQPKVVFLTSMQTRLSRLEQLGYAWVRFQKIGFGTVCPRTRVIMFRDVVKTKKHQLEVTPIDPGSAPAFILPTGGTTGSPKAVTLSHRNLLSQAWQLSHWSRGTHGEEKILAVLPFFHSYGLSSSVMMGLALGATLVIHHRFRPQSTVDLIARHRPTMFMAVPAMLAALNTKVLRQGHHDLSSIRAVISGGAALPASVMEEFCQHTGAIVVEGYGLSEASPVTHVGPIDGTAIQGSIGLPLPDTDARIVDPNSGETKANGEIGELVVRGPQVMLGYWNDPSATEHALRGGWLHTGDLATCDDKGYFRIVDRIKDLIITSGFNVYPGDVEEVLRGYPGVRDVAVVGMPDAERGEIVKAIVVVDSLKTFQRREFQHFAHQHLAAYKRPRVIEVQTQDLPRNFLGKVLRRELRVTTKTNGHNSTNRNGNSNA